MSKNATFLRSTVLLTLANFAMRGVSMAFQVFLTDAIGAAGIGLLQLILTVNGFAITLGTSGLRVGTMYLTAEEYGHKRLHGVRQVMSCCLVSGLVLSTLVGILLTFVSEPLAQYWVKDLQAASSLRLLGLTLPLTCISTILSGYFTACGKIGRLVTVEILDRIFSALLTVCLLRLGPDGELSHAYLSIIGGSALASFGSVAVLSAMMFRDFRKFPVSEKQHDMGKRLSRFCIPVALNDYLRSGLGTLEQFLIPHGLSKSSGSRTSALADYGTIHGMVFPAMMFPSTVLFAVSDLLVPRLARCLAEKHKDEIRTLVRRTLRCSIVFSASIGGLLFVLSDALGLLLYDSAAAASYFRIFAPLVPVLYLDCIVDGIHKGMGQQIYCVRVNTLTNLMDVVFLFLLLPRFGIGGYIFTYTLTHVINFYLSFRQLLIVADLIPAFSYPAVTILSVTCATAIVCIFLPASAVWSTTLVRSGIYLSILTLLLILSGTIDKCREKT